MPYIVTAQAVTDAFLLHVAKVTGSSELERTRLFARNMLAVCRGVCTADQ